MTTTQPGRPRSRDRSDDGRSDLRRLYAAEVLSGAGDGIFWVALVVSLSGRPNFDVLLALAVLARLGPRALLSVPSGSIVDRSDLRTLLVRVDLMRGALMTALGLLTLADLHPAGVLGLVLASYVVGVPSRPALAAALPQVSGETHLARATARLSTIRQVMTFVGPFVGVGVVVWSPAAGFLVNGATFVVAAVLFTGVRSMSPAGGRRASGSGRAGPLARVRDAFDRGVGVIRHVDALPGLIGLVAAMYFVRGAEMVIHVLVVRDVLDARPEAIGYFGGAVGVGAVASMGVAARAADGDRPMRSLLVAVACTAIPTALLAAVVDLPQAMALLVVVGIGMVLFEVVSVVTIQRLIPPVVVGRAFGTVNAASNAGKLAGAIVAPALASVVGVRGSLVVVAVVVTATAAAVSASLRRLGPMVTERRRTLAPDVAVLSSLAVFEGASRTSLERIAAAISVRQVPAGTVLIREGDEPDDLFIAREGTFEVVTDGRPIAHLHPGDWFGEIGLVDRVPRTATVSATTDSMVWAIPGDVFLQTLEDAVAAPSALLQGIADRLAGGRLPPE